MSKVSQLPNMAFWYCMHGHQAKTAQLANQISYLLSNQQGYKTFRAIPAFVFLPRGLFAGLKSYMWQ